MKPNIETFIGCERRLRGRGYGHIRSAFWIPRTSYRPGGFGSSAMRHESFGLETYSPYQNRDLTDYKIF